MSLFAELKKKKKTFTFGDVNRLNTITVFSFIISLILVRDMGAMYILRLQSKEKIDRTDEVHTALLLEGGSWCCGFCLQLC